MLDFFFEFSDHLKVQGRNTNYRRFSRHHVKNIHSISKRTNIRRHCDFSNLPPVSCLAPEEAPRERKHCESERKYSTAGQNECGE